MRLHPASLLVGAALMVGVGLISAQSFVATVTDVRVRNPIKVRGVADPRDVVRVVEGQPFTVPAGKLLVVTAIGDHADLDIVSVTVDGVTEATIRSEVQSPFQSTVMPLPAPGLVCDAGQVVEVVGGGQPNPDDARAWGYLVND